jgi:hypothetical protein
MTEEDGNFEHSTQKEEERHTTTIFFEFLRRPQELSNHISSGGHATSYNKSDRWSSVTIV